MGKGLSTWGFEGTTRGLRLALPVYGLVCTPLLFCAPGILQAQSLQFGDIDALRRAMQENAVTEKPEKDKVVVIPFGVAGPEVNREQVEDIEDSIMDSFCFDSQIRKVFTCRTSSQNPTIKAIQDEYMFQKTGLTREQVERLKAIPELRKFPGAKRLLVYRVSREGGTFLVIGRLYDLDGRPITPSSESVQAITGSTLREAKQSVRQGFGPAMLDLVLKHDPDPALKDARDSIRKVAGVVKVVDGFNKMGPLIADVDVDRLSDDRKVELIVQLRDPIFLITDGLTEVGLANDPDYKTYFELRKTYADNAAALDVVASCLRKGGRWRGGCSMPSQTESRRPPPQPSPSSSSTRTPSSSSSSHSPCRDCAGFSWLVPGSGQAFKNRPAWGLFWAGAAYAGYQNWATQYKKYENMKEMYNVPLTYGNTTTNFLIYSGLRSEYQKAASSASAAGSAALAIYLLNVWNAYAIDSDSSFFSLAPSSDSRRTATRSPREWIVIPAVVPVGAQQAYSVSLMIAF